MQINDFQVSRVRRLYLSSVLLRVAALLVVLPLFRDAHAQQYARVSEKSFRSMASKQVLPEYPAEAIHKLQTGVVVADVTLDKDHHISKIDILESPSPLLSRAAIASVREWTFFRPAGPTLYATLSGKLTFYFVRYEGHFKVFNSTDAPHAPLR